MKRASAGCQVHERSRRPDRLTLFLLAVGLVAITLAAYRQVGGFSFVFFDDMEYVTDNPIVKAGLTKDGLKWAFSGVHVSNYHPLTWVSHMTDVELFGVEPGAHHLVNLFLHAANTVILFLVLNGMTGAPFRSAFVSALFAVHPLHVESVAWISGRKDLLSAFFGLLAVWAYARYAKLGGIWRYLAVSGFFLLGLLSKSMLVTLPFILLLIDFWPLRRAPFKTDDILPQSEWTKTTVRRMVLEKVPLLMLSVIFSAATFLAQQTGGSVSGIPLGARLANAIVSFTAYLRMTVWPKALTMFYPHPSFGAGLDPLSVVGAAAIFCALSFLAVREARRHPWIFTGWFWYVGTLVPVIGLIQVGRQAMADRYTYLPLIGVFIAVSWTAPCIVERWRFKKPLLYGTAAIVLSALTATTSVQASYWKNSQTLFVHALDVIPDNWLANDTLGTFLIGEGRHDEAEPYLWEAVRINPMLEDAWNNLGVISLKKGRLDEAAVRISKSLDILQENGIAHLNMGNVCFLKGDRYQAISHYNKALLYSPDSPDARYNLASALQTEGRLDEAVYQYRAALELKPDHAAAHNNLGSVLLQKGNVSESIDHFRAALRLNPADEIARANLDKAVRSSRSR